MAQVTFAITSAILSCSSSQMIKYFSARMVCSKNYQWFTSMSSNCSLRTEILRPASFLSSHLILSVCYR